MIEQQDYILWAYRLLLGREPESPEALQWPETERQDIVRRFLASAEFLQQHPKRAWIADPDFWFINELANGARFWLCGNDETVAPGVVTGSYKPADTAFVRRQLRRGMNVVDIGANIGWFTVNMAMLVGPGGRVDAFEPRENTARYLRRTVAENKLGNVVVHRCALADENGNGTIVSNEPNLPQGTARLIVGDTPTPETTAEQVTLRRLDSVVWGGVDFIKIAVDGAERIVLDGAEIVLGRDRPLILSEINEALLRQTSGISVPDYLSYFEEIDYEVRRLLPNGRCGEHATFDYIAQAGEPLGVACVPAEKASEILLR